MSDFFLLSFVVKPMVALKQVRLLPYCIFWNACPFKGQKFSVIELN